MTTKRSGSNHGASLAVLSAFLLANGIEPIPPVQPFPTPPIMGGGGGDSLFPFLVGVFFFLTLLIVVIGFVLLPHFARMFGGRIDEGRSCVIAIPLAIITLVFIWKPLHLGEASIWVTVAGLILFVLGILAAIGSAIFQNWEEAFAVGVTGVATILFYVQTSWGFWLSLLAGFGAMLFVAGVCDLFTFVARLARKAMPQGRRR